MQFIVRPAAAADIDDAFLWYKRQRPGLGHYLPPRRHQLMPSPNIPAGIPLFVALPGAHLSAASLMPSINGCEIECVAVA